MSLNVFASIIGLSAFLVLAFLLLRSVFLWYWKINDVVKHLEEINKNIGILVINSKPIPTAYISENSKKIESSVGDSSEFILMDGHDTSDKWKFRAFPDGGLEIINAMGGSTKYSTLDEAKSVYRWWKNYPENQKNNQFPITI